MLMKCMDAALAPLRFQCIRVLNYLDDWLILAHSRELVSCHRDIVLRHIHSLGLRMNAKKSVLFPSQRTMFFRDSLGFRSDAGQFGSCPDINFTACLACFKLGHHVSVSTCRRLLGLMAAASPVLLLGLLHMGMHLCPESSWNSGRTRAGTGMTLEKQRGPPPLCQTDTRSGIPSDGSTSIPPAWASVSTENRPPGSVFPEREPPSKRGTCLGTKGEDGAQACPGCARPWTSLAVYVGHNRHIVRPDYDMIPPRTGRKYFKARKTALSSRQFICQERNSCFHSPLAGLPSKTAPQPVIDASVVIIWRQWITPILTPLQSRHIKRGRQQLRDTLIRRVAGTVGCNLSSFIHQRNGLMWNNPRGNKGEAAAMRPNSLRQVPTETWSGPDIL